MPDTRMSTETHNRLKEAFPVILAEIAAGGIIGRLLEAKGFSRDMARLFIAVEPGARTLWNEAREASADAFFEQAQDITLGEMPDPKAARVKLQALMWLASKRNPRVYSEKQQIDLNVKTVDLTAVIQAANARLLAAQAPRLVGSGIASEPLDVVPFLSAIDLF